MPIKQASEALGISVTVLKFQCRKLKISRWPYRKIQVINDLIEKTSSAISAENHNQIIGPKSKHLLKTVEQLRAHRQELLNLEKTQLDPGISALAARVNKHEFKRRCEEVPRDKVTNEPILPINLNSYGKVVGPQPPPSCRVLKLGTIVYDRPTYHNSNYIWPVGYVAEREYASFTQLDKKATYKCEILDNGASPLFKLTASDRPSQPISGGSTTAVWQVVARRIAALKAHKKASDITGPECFCLSLPTVRKLIEELPNADKCEKYEMKNFQINCDRSMMRKKEPKPSRPLEDPLEDQEQDVVVEKRARLNEDGTPTSSSFDKLMREGAVMIVQPEDALRDADAVARVKGKKKQSRKQATPKRCRGAVSIMVEGQQALTPVRKRTSEEVVNPVTPEPPAAARVKAKLVLAGEENREEAEQFERPTYDALVAEMDSLKDKIRKQTAEHGGLISTVASLTAKVRAMQPQREPPENRDQDQPAAARVTSINQSGGVMRPSIGYGITVPVRSCDQAGMRSQPEAPSTSNAGAEACAFCGSCEENEEVGELIEAEGKTVHEMCALWAPQCYEDDDEEVRNVDKELRRSKRLRCAHCGRGHAAIGCFVPSCRRSYHLSCARIAGCQLVHEKFAMWCPIHRTQPMDETPADAIDDEEEPAEPDADVQQQQNGHEFRFTLTEQNDALVAERDGLKAQLRLMRQEVMEENAKTEGELRELTDRARDLSHKLEAVVAERDDLLGKSRRDAQKIRELEKTITEQDALINRAVGTLTQQSISRR